MAWADAWMNKKPFKADGSGIGYMLAGDTGASNIDPYATASTATNQWVAEGPHIMVVVADPAQLEGLSTDPNSGGAYVMWKGTPYARTSWCPWPHAPNNESDHHWRGVASANEALTFRYGQCRQRFAFLLPCCALPAKMPETNADREWVSEARLTFKSRRRTALLDRRCSGGSP